MKKNFIFAFFSQAIALLISIFSSLVLPEFLGVENYGFYQLFIFYANYVGFALLGLNDGIYLRFGGEHKQNMDKSMLSTQFNICAAFQFILAVLGFIALLVVPMDKDRQFVLSATLIFMIVYNLSGYIGYVFQTVNDTHLYSKSVIIEKVVFVVLLLALFAFKVRAHEAYILSYTIGKGACLGYCIIVGRDYIFCKQASLPAAFKEIAKNIKVGINLMLANIASLLILGIGRFFIDIRWGIESFSKISLLLSIISFVLVFITQVSMVLFPQLRRNTEGERRHLYNKLSKLFLYAMPFVFILYAPAKLFIDRFLPNYSDAVFFLVYLLPFCGFEAKTSLLFNTYMKVYRKQHMLLIFNVISALTSLVLSIICAYVLNSLTAVVISMVIAVGIRCYCFEYYLAKIMGNKNTARICFEIAFIALFVVLFDILPLLTSNIILLAAIPVYIFVQNKFLNKSI